jgi:hypothetical protein
MEAKLIKNTAGEFYLIVSKPNNMFNTTFPLSNGQHAIASSHAIDGVEEFPKLSKQNCDELFGVVDVDKWVKEKVDNRFNETDGYHKVVYVEGLVEGFNKAMELNKDKLFTLEDMMNCWNKALKFQDHKQTFGEYIQSIQQPTEIEVEIVTVPALSNNGNVYYGDIPKLDSNRCLILKIKE